jgi:hypothetical protein
MPVTAQPPGIAVEIGAVGPDGVLEVLRSAGDVLLLARLDTDPGSILTRRSVRF